MAVFWLSLIVSGWYAGEELYKWWKQRQAQKNAKLRERIARQAAEDEVQAERAAAAGAGGGDDDGAPSSPDERAGGRGADDDDDDDDDVDEDKQQ